MNDVTILQCGYHKKAVKASEFLLRQRNIQFSIENARYLLKDVNRCTYTFSNSVDVRRRVSEILGE